MNKENELPDGNASDKEWRLYLAREFTNLLRKHHALESELSKLKATGKEVADSFWNERCKADKRIEELENEINSLAKKYGELGEVLRECEEVLHEAHCCIGKGGLNDRIEGAIAKIRQEGD